MRGEVKELVARRLQAYRFLRGKFLAQVGNLALAETAAECFFYGHDLRLGAGKTAPLQRRASSVDVRCGTSQRRFRGRSGRTVKVDVAHQEERRRAVGI